MCARQVRRRRMKRGAPDRSSPQPGTAWGRGSEGEGWRGRRGRAGGAGEGERGFDRGGVPGRCCAPAVNRRPVRALATWGQPPLGAARPGRVSGCPTCAGRLLCGAPLPAHARTLAHFHGAAAGARGGGAGSGPAAGGAAARAAAVHARLTLASGRGGTVPAAALAADRLAGAAAAAVRGALLRSAGRPGAGRVLGIKRGARAALGRRAAVCGRHRCLHRCLWSRAHSLRRS